MAVIIFQIVDAPRSKGAGILLLEAVTGCPSAAGKLSRIRIDAQLQALGVDIIGKRLDAIRKFLRVWNDVVVAVTTALPQVINEDVLVTSISESMFHHGIGSFLNQFLADVPLKEIPGHPSHRGSLGQLVTFQKCFAFLCKR